MATGTAIATAVQGAVGVGSGLSKFFEGRRMQKKAEKFIENFEWQDLENPYENLQVSTLGSDLMTEQSNVGAANATEALRSGGARGLANIGKVEAQRNIVARQVGAGLDEQQKKIDYASANQQVVNQKMNEVRQTNELAGYGQMMNVGMGMKYGGLANVANAIGTIGQSFGGVQGGTENNTSSSSSPTATIDYLNGYTGTQGNGYVSATEMFGQPS